MSIAGLIILALTTGAVAFVLFGLKAAYYNGVVDGYGYSMEPRNPGYQKAGRYLRKYMYHRWNELLHIQHGEDK